MTESFPKQQLIPQEPITDQFGRVKQKDGSWNRPLTKEEMQIYLAQKAEKAAALKEKTLQEKQDRIDQEAAEKTKRYTKEQAFDFVVSKLQGTFKDLQDNVNSLPSEADPHLSFCVYIETKTASTHAIKIEKNYENCVSLKGNKKIAEIVKSEIAKELLEMNENQFCITELRIDAAITKSDGNTYLDLGLATDRTLI